MELFIDFLVNNYLWFLVITIILIFSLIGYFVESKETFIGKEKISPIDMEKSFEALAAEAQNKTISEVLHKKETSINQMQPNNTIEERTQVPLPNSSFVNPNNMVLPQPIQNNQNMNQNQGSNNQTMNMNSGMMNQNVQNNPQAMNQTSFEILGK